MACVAGLGVYSIGKPAPATRTRTAQPAAEAAADHAADPAAKAAAETAKQDIALSMALAHLLSVVSRCSIANFKPLLHFVGDAVSALVETIKTMTRTRDFDRKLPELSTGLAAVADSLQTVVQVVADSGGPDNSGDPGAYRLPAWLTRELVVHRRAVVARSPEFATAKTLLLRMDQLVGVAWSWVTLLRHLFQLEASGSFRYRAVRRKPAEPDKKPEKPKGRTRAAARTAAQETSDGATSEPDESDDISARTRSARAARRADDDDEQETVVYVNTNLVNASPRRTTGEPPAPCQLRTWRNPDNRLAVRAVVVRADSEW